MKSKNYDIVIVGGGVAGVAAAVEASRSGLKTAIVEKTILFGGLATSGLVDIYVPLCDGKGRQVTFGLAEEFLKLAIKYGPGQIPDNWLKEKDKDGIKYHKIYGYDNIYPEAENHKRYMSIFSCVSFALALDEILETSGVDLWLDTLACEPVVENKKVTGIEIENKSGRILLKAAAVIDTTGDASIAFRAGAPCEEIGSYPTYLYQYTSLGHAKKAVATNSARRLVKWKTAGGDELYDGDSSAGRLYAEGNGADMSEFVMKSRKIAREKLAEKQALGGDNSRENLFAVTLPTMAQFRRSRRIAGQETVKVEQRNQYCDTSIGMITDCRNKDAVWEVPYHSLIPRGIENLIVAGRCTSAESYAWHVSRLIPSAALTGQIAGIASVIAVKSKTSPSNLAIRDVQKAAENRGIVLHL